MELALIRSLMDREFYDDHRGAKCPDKLIPGNNEETIPRDKATFINLFIS